MAKKVKAKTAPPPPPIILTVTPRIADVHVCSSDPGPWSAGKTLREALGDFVLNNHAKLGIELNFPDSRPPRPMRCCRRFVRFW